jgi:hypothetical protein
MRGKYEQLNVNKQYVNPISVNHWIFGPLLGNMNEVHSLKTLKFSRR